MTDARDEAEAVERMVAFAALLREEGIGVPAAAVGDALAALACIDPPEPRAAHAALRCVLVNRREDLAGFERAFAEFWLGLTGFTTGDEDDVPDPETGDGDHVRPGEASALDRDDSPSGPHGLAVERLRTLDLAAYGSADMRAAQRLMERIARTLPRRLTRRLGPDPRGGRLDVRRTLIDSMHTSGVPLRRAWRSPRTRQVPLVLVLDVSGSMQPYAKALLAFALAAVRADRQVEAFTFGTRLTRVTEMLGARRPGAAVAAVAAAVPDWRGGTRIGENIATLNRRWASQGFSRRAIVVILSDGWDCGDPDLLGSELARLRRSARAVLWANPLAAVAGYEPLTAGMVAALPQVDRLVPVGNLAGLERMTQMIASYAFSAAAN